jgi:hypothetical protein
MATGVSLKGADAVLVLLQPSDAGHVPIALPVSGNYNRLGSIDGIDENENTDLLLAFFHDALRTGTFVVDEGYLTVCGFFPIQDVETLLQGFERNINDHPQAAVLNGRPVVFALFAKAVWDEITSAMPPTDEPVPAAYRRLFPGGPIPESVYADRWDDVSGHVECLTAVDAFLKARGIAWKPADDPGQDYADDMRRYLAEARQTFADSPTVLTGLRAYEHEVSDLLQDD